MFWFSHFKKAFKITIGHEGGYVNNPNDKGGETKYGISKRAYPNINIARLTLNEAKAIYKKDYYDKQFDRLSESIATELFDTGVNMGLSTAKKMLQEALNLLNRNEIDFKDLVVDGKIGKKTISAYKKINDVKLLKALNGLQFVRYMKIAKADTSQEAFMNGWLTRI